MALSTKEDFRKEKQMAWVYSNSPQALSTEVSSKMIKSFWESIFYQIKNSAMKELSKIISTVGTGNLQSKDVFSTKVFSKITRWKDKAAFAIVMDQNTLGRCVEERSTVKGYGRKKDKDLRGYGEMDRDKAKESK